MRVLSRAWQILLKGITEVSEAPKPVTAAEMVLVRLAYAADLPTPDEALKMLTQESYSGSSTPTGSPSGGGTRMTANGGLTVAARTGTAPMRASEVVPTMRIASFEDLVTLATEKRDIGP